MKTKLILLLCSFMLLLSSCGGSNSEEDIEKEVAEKAHALGCMTYKEFEAIQFSREYQKVLPCMVYLDHFDLLDISNSETLQSDRQNKYVRIFFEPENVSKADISDWVGTVGDYPANFAVIRDHFTEDGSCDSYLGLSDEQADWLAKKANNGSIIIHTPIIIKVYQVKIVRRLIGSTVIYKANMVRTVDSN